MPDIHECTHLEDWVRPSKSVIWSFNRSYWRHLGAWDQTFHKDYAAALPGGVSDGTNPEFWADRIDAFMATLNRLEEWSELPDEIHVLEFGVGDGQGAKVWLDCFAAACEEQGRDYLGRVRYLMADYSPHVLARAKQRVSGYGDIVQGLELDFRNPMSALADLRGKLLFAHTCNVYDNLPTDEVMRVGDHAYEPLVRASITPGEMAELAADARHRAGRDRLRRPARPARGARVHRRALGRRALLGRRVGRRPPRGDLRRDRGPVGPARGAQRRRPSRRARRRAAGVDARPHVDGGRRELRADAAAAALRGHPGGPGPVRRATSAQYASFRGPGKLEGSIVNWINAPIFQLLGERSGFVVTVEPFAYREGSNISVLSARHRDAYRRPSGDEDHELATEARDAGFGAVVA